MFFTLYSFRGRKVFEDVFVVMVKTPTGEITVLDHHLPLITPVERGFVTVMKNGNEKEVIDISGGILEVRPGSDVTLLADE